METKDRVLIVDDDPNILSLLTEAIASEGLHVLSSTNGEEALKIFEGEKLDMLIVDGLLPRMNGFELTAKVRSTEKGRNLPIIMISGVYKSLRMNDQIRDLEINDFLEKPFSLEELLRRVKDLLLVQETSKPEVDFFEHKGDLGDVPMARIIYMLYSHRENGILFLSREKLKKKLHIKNGEPTFVESNLVQECLGKLLVRKGKLSPEQCDESLRLMRSQKTRQGETLINMGLLSPNDLDEALKDQAREKILEAFGWTEGKYVFKPMPHPAKNLTPVDLTLPQIILRGVRGGMSLEQLKKELDPYLDKAIHSKVNPRLKLDDFKLASWDQRVVTEIDGKKSLRDILATKAAREIDIYQLIFTMIKTDMIEFAETDDERRAKGTYVKLNRFLQEVKNQDYFNVLGISRKPDDKELFAGLSKKMAMYHPTTSDFNPTGAEKIKRLLADIIHVFQEAHDTLKDPEKRQQYERDLYYNKGIVPAFPSKVFNQDDEFQKIRITLKGGNFSEVEKHTDSMSYLFPGDWRFKAYHGWAAYKKLSQEGKPSASTLKKYIDEIGDAVRIERNEADGYYFLGSIYFYLEENDKARAFFQKALECEPNMLEASRELRLLDNRESKKGKSFIRWK